MRNWIEMKKTLSMLLTICAAIGWWGALYPQFTLTRDTCRVVTCKEEDGAQDMPEMCDGAQDETRMCGSARNATEMCDIARDEQEKCESVRGLAKQGEPVIESEFDGGRLYWDILEAESGQIRFQSKLLSDWRNFHESRSR